MSTPEFIVIECHKWLIFVFSAYDIKNLVTVWGKCLSVSERSHSVCLESKIHKMSYLLHFNDHNSRCKHIITRQMNLFFSSTL